MEGSHCSAQMERNVIKRTALFTVVIAVLALVLAACGNIANYPSTPLVVIQRRRRSSSWKRSTAAQQPTPNSVRQAVQT